MNNNTEMTLNNDDLNKSTGMQCPTQHATGKPCAGCEKCETFDLVRDQRDILDALFKDSQAQIRTLTAENQALASRVSESEAGNRELLAALKEALEDLECSEYAWDHPFLIKLRAVIAKNGGAA